MITSDAVYRNLNALTYIKNLSTTSYNSFIQFPMGVYSLPTSVYSNFPDKPSGLNGRAVLIVGGVERSNEQIALALGAGNGKAFLGYCYGGTQPNYTWKTLI